MPRYRPLQEWLNKFKRDAAIVTNDEVDSLTRQWQTCQDPFCTGGCRNHGQDVTVTYRRQAATWTVIIGPPRVVLYVTTGAATAGTLEEAYALATLGLNILED